MVYIMKFIMNPRDQVMRYVLTFLNNSVNTMGFVVKEEEIEDI